MICASQVKFNDSLPTINEYLLISAQLVDKERISSHLSECFKQVSENEFESEKINIKLEDGKH